MRARLREILLSTLPKNLVIDLYDMAAAQARGAFEMVRDHSGLDPKRERALVGQARFRMMEKGFEEVCKLHGGVSLDGGLIPGSGLKVFQPFMRFASPDAGIGVILGLAAMSEKRGLPSKNLSREAGITLNYHLTPRLDFDGTGPKPGDIFVLFLFASDPRNVGRIEEVAIGVIDSAYKQFIFYEPIESFMAGYAAEPTGSPPNDDGPPPPIVTLKRFPKSFVPPEEGSGENEDEGKA